MGSANALTVHFTAGTGDEVFEFSSHTTNATPGTGYDRYFAHPEEDEWWNISASLSLDAADGVPTVSIAATDAEAWETPLTAQQDNKLTFTVTRSGNTDNALTVLLHPPAGTATGSDYDSIPASVTIAAGQSSTTFDVTAVQDNTGEPDETVALCLKAAQNYRLGAYTAGGTIRDFTGNIGFNNDNGRASDPSHKLLPGTPDALFAIDADDEKTEDNGAGFKFWWGTNTGGPQFTPDNVTDLAPFVIDIPELPANSNLLPYLKLQISNAQSGLFFIYPNRTGADNRLKYLSDFQTAQTLANASSGQTFRALGGSITETLLVDSQGQALTSGHYEFLIRGVGSGLVSAKFTLELKPQQGNAISLDTANVTFQNPTDFYSVISSRNASSTRPFSYLSENGRSETMSIYDYTVKRDRRNTEVKKTVIFIHGYNVDVNEAETTFAVTYQRMFWQGFRGNFVGWDWNGDDRDFGAATLFTPNVDHALHTSPTLWIAVRNLMEAATSDGGWGLQPSDIDVVAHSLGNLVMWDALRLNTANTTDKFVNSMTSIEAAVWGDAFASPSDLSNQYDSNGELIAYIDLPSDKQQKVTWRSWFNPTGRPIKSGLTGKVINSYNPTDFALIAMQGNETGFSHQNAMGYFIQYYGENHPYRTASNLAWIYTRLREDAQLHLGGNVWNFDYTDLDRPIGMVSNPLADVNLNATNDGLGWRTSEHSDFKALAYPLIWNWWKKVFVDSGGIAIGSQT